MNPLYLVDPIGRLLLAFGLPLALFFAGASPVVMLMGVVSWAVAVALKTPVYRLLAKLLPSKSSAVIATRIGIASALLELGTSAAYLACVWKSLSLLDVFAFGAAVGSFEVVFTAVWGILIVRKLAKQKQAAPSLGATNPPATAYFAALVERAGAAVGHVGSRGMIYATFLLGAPGLALLAVALFSIIDGLAVYGSTRKWNWLEPKTFAWFYSAIWLIALVEMALFVISVR